MNGLRTILLVLVAVSGCPSAAQEPNRGGTVSLATQDVELARRSFTTAPGYVVELFASERDFDLRNPVALAFDSRGRLWVACMPGYPMSEPGAKPDDHILVLEDSDGDGRADRQTVFARGLCQPTGFELGEGGVFAIDQPNLVFLRDTDGDDVADSKEIVLHGFGTEDSHHVASTFEWAPGGELLSGEGVFLHTQIETPYGVVRLSDGGFLGFDPKTGAVRSFASAPFLNPWGQTFDRFGDWFVGDASDGKNLFASPMTGRIDWPAKHRMVRDFTSRVRPTAGIEFVSSRHFPPDAQGDLLVANCIGFRGIKQHRVTREGPGVRSEPAPDLLSSADPNFRPVDLRFGPDGALWVVDWFNPLIGHMQYSLFDERRDRAHGRIWRVVAEDRPLLTPSAIDRADEDVLLGLLREPEDRTRYRVRRELRQRPRSKVSAAVDRALGRGGLESADEHWLLEILWTCQGWHLVREDLLRRLLEAREPRVRAAAVTVLAAWRDQVSEPLRLLRERAQDESDRVRLEVIVAASHFGTADAAEIALAAADGGRAGDPWIGYALDETLFALRPAVLAVLHDDRPFCADEPTGLDRALAALLPGELLALPPSPRVLRSILGRADVPLAARRSALLDASRAGAVEPIAEAIAWIRDAAAASPPVADDALAPVLELVTSADPRELVPHRDALRELTTMPSPAVATAAYRALLDAEMDAGELWSSAGDPDRRCSLLAAIPSAIEPAAHAALVPRLLELLRASDADLAPRPSDVRFIRLALPGADRAINVAEIEVLDETGENIAPRGVATQSSIGFGGRPELAIDGGTDGRHSAGSMAHTAIERDPWWQLELRDPVAPAAVRIWNRTEKPWDRRLQGFTLELRDSRGRVVWRRTGLPAPERTGTVPIDGGDAVALRAAAVTALAAVADDVVVARAIAALPEPRHEPVLEAALAAAAPRADAGDIAVLLVPFVRRVLADTPESRRARPFYWRAIEVAELVAAHASDADADDLRSRAAEGRVRIPSPEELADGRAIYAAVCAACHQADGRGLAGAFPPLVGSEWLARPSDHLIRIVLHGLGGPIEVAGTRYDGVMASFGPVLDDARVAAVLSYVRAELGGRVERVAPEEVRDVRARHADRTEPWRPDELR